MNIIPHTYIYRVYLIIYRTLLKIFPLAFKKYIIRLYYRLNRVIFHCKEIFLFTKQKEPIYYIIHRDEPTVGLFSNVIVFLENIVYAQDNGYIPVIDMKNYSNTYLEKDEIGKINSWEYYFEQPVIFNDEIDQLKSAYDSNNFIINNGSQVDRKVFYHPEFFSPDFLINTEEIKKWHTYYTKYIRLNKKTKEYINKQYDSLVKLEDKVLGVFVRGTDYRNLKPSGHPIQPDVEEVIERTEKALKEWECNKIFLSTEDGYIRELFLKKFGDLVITNQREYYNHNSNSVTQEQHNREKDRYMNGLEYLTSLVILSRANSIIASSTSGMVGVILMSDGFENSYFYNLGKYP